MSKEDVEAGRLYIDKNWKSWTLFQKVDFIRKYHSDRAVREEYENLFREYLEPILHESELIAKQQMLAPYYQPGDERSEARFAAMVARKYGLTWWRDTKSTIERLGAMDDAWHSEFFEPITSKLPTWNYKIKAWEQPHLDNIREPDKTLASWPTITQVSNGLGNNKGTVSRLIANGKLRDNGLTHNARRIDPASILEYCEANGVTYNET